MYLDLEASRERLVRDLEHFNAQLKTVRTEYERERLETTIRGTEMMLAAVYKQIPQAAE
ncbi:hypothetical protein [Afipia sp. DC4300-2b1]|uniref:hypothetical protein n=1 Tax=Afipia sp. DC4300-2b1 TaxID=2804672 RepID=UPI003CECDED3